MGNGRRRKPKNLEQILNETITFAQFLPDQVKMQINRKRKLRHELLTIGT
jgi:hypothetical protein